VSSVLGDFLGHSRVQRGNSETAIKESNKAGKKAARLSTAKPKKVSTAVSETLDFKATGDPSPKCLGRFSRAFACAAG
jgi:hypothetical protein